MQQLTTDQQAYVLSHYQKKTKGSIAKKLDINPEDLQKFADINGISLIDRFRMKSEKLTEYQERYISQNSTKKSVYQIACKVNATFYQVKKYIEDNNLPKFEREYLSGAKKKPEPEKNSNSKIVEVPVYIPDEKRTVIVTKYIDGETKRPPAQYSNPDWTKMYLDSRF